MEILDKIRETYDLKGVDFLEYYLGSDYISTQKLKDIALEDVKVIVYAGHDESDKKLSTIWLKQNIKTAFSARTYINNAVDRMDNMIGNKCGSYN